MAFEGGKTIQEMFQCDLGYVCQVEIGGREELQVEQYHHGFHPVTGEDLDLEVFAIETFLHTPFDILPYHIQQE